MFYFLEIKNFMHKLYFQFAKIMKIVIRRGHDEVMAYV